MSASTRPVVLSPGQQHLANRFSFGVSESLVRDVRKAGSAQAWFEKQLKWGQISDTQGSRVIRWYPRLRDSPAKAWSNAKSGRHTGWDYGFDFARYTTARKLTSRRQTHEVMTDFWSNLLYIPAYEDRSFPWRYRYDAVVRRNALGTFRGLLRSTVVHPAMSGWLNNNTNVKGGINENLGRELLELFTVGRPSGYDEDDVQNSARLLTGYKVEVFDGYAASYDRHDHYVGRVKILGFQHANSSSDGRAAVAAYLDYLARHPATARRIATRLCVRFVSDTPSRSIVNAVTKAYRASDTDIKSTLRALVRHPDFKASRMRKVRTPVEDVVNTARVLGLRPTGDGSTKALAHHVIWMSSSLGQNPLTWPRPDGFPETSATWASPARVLRGWDLHYALAGNWWLSRQMVRPTRPHSMPTRWPRTLGELVNHQSRMLLGRAASYRLRAAVSTALHMSQSKKFHSSRDVTDWTWTVIRATVLNAPEGMLR